MAAGVAVVVLAVLAMGAAAAPASKSGLYVWQGFDYEWRRTMVGFNTPHRLGPFEARVEAGDLSDPTDAASVAHMEFDVGVDGDFSEPHIFSTAVVGDNLWVSDTVVDTKTVTDNASKANPSAPTAQTKYTSTITVTLPSGADRRDSYVALLQGVAVGMHCDQAKQDEGDKCNSDGMWPQKFSFALSACSADDTAMSCQLDVDIVRSWTPMKGGGKPFNYKMDLSIKTYVTVLGGNKSDMNVVVPPPAVAKASNHDQDITRVDTVVEQTATGYDKAVVGLQGIEFVLNDDREDRKGRYLQRLALHVGEEGQDGKGHIKFASYMGYLSPKTVYPSSVAMSARTVVIQLGSSVRMSHEQVYSTGHICRSGFAFSCKMKNMEETNTCTVPVHDTPNPIMV